MTNQTTIQLQLIGPKPLVVVTNQQLSYIVNQQQAKHCLDLANFHNNKAHNHLNGPVPPQYTALQISLQAHTGSYLDLFQNKYWIVLKGEATVRIDKLQQTLSAQQAILIPKMKEYQLINHQDQPLELIQFESQTQLNGQEQISFSAI